MLAQMCLHVSVFSRHFKRTDLLHSGTVSKKQTEMTFLIDWVLFVFCCFSYCSSSQNNFNMGFFLMQLLFNHTKIIHSHPYAHKQHNKRLMDRPQHKRTVPANQVSVTIVMMCVQSSCRHAITHMTTYNMCIICHTNPYNFIKIAENLNGPNMFKTGL